MVCFPSGEETLEILLQPYVTELQIQLPVQYVLEESGPMKGIMKEKEKSHVLHVNGMFYWEGRQNRLAPVNECAQALLVTELCKLYLAERMAGIVTMDEVSGDPALENFSLLHNRLINVWANDVMHRRWRGLHYQKMCAMGEGLRCMVAEMFGAPHKPGEILEILYDIAEQESIVIRHGMDMPPQARSLEMLARNSPWLALNLAELIVCWSSLPSITGDRETNMKKYRESVAATVKAAHKKSKTVLRKKRGEYRWYIDG